MELRFWGVRGSVPSPEPDKLGIGGNTTCVSVERHSHLHIFDAGTGIVRLGRHLEETQRSDIRGSIFLSHYHWDHIQGLPFFSPAFREENRFHLYGLDNKRLSLHDVLADQMQPPYFPIGMDNQEALVTFNPLSPHETIEVSDVVTVRTIGLNHPNGSLGFRLEAPEGVVCIITDHEHSVGEIDAEVVAFADGADVLIHEAPYHPEEKKGAKAGWGHSSWEEAALTAKAAGVKRLFLSHHDPERCDADIFEMQSKARNIFMKTDIAMERTVIRLSE